MNQICGFQTVHSSHHLYACISMSFHLWHHTRLPLLTVTELQSQGCCPRAWSSLLLPASKVFWTFQAKVPEWSPSTICVHWNVQLNVKPALTSSSYAPSLSLSSDKIRDEMAADNHLSSIWYWYWWYQTDTDGTGTDIMVLLLFVLALVLASS